MILILVIPKMMAGLGKTFSTVSSEQFVDPEALQELQGGGAAQQREPPPRWVSPPVD